VFPATFSILLLFSPYIPLYREIENVIMFYLRISALEKDTPMKNSLRFAFAAAVLALATPSISYAFPRPPMPYPQNSLAQVSSISSAFPRPPMPYPQNHSGLQL